MEEKREFKILNAITTNTSSTTGRALPIVQSLVVLGFTEANANGEANKVKPVKTTRSKNIAVKQPKATSKASYSNHTFLTMFNNVTIVLKPNTKLELDTFADFIHATEDPTIAINIVDILPNLYYEHFNIITNPIKRIMIGDLVTVNFKYRSTIELKNIKQKEPVRVENIKFVNLKNMTVIVAYLTNKDFYPINELDLYDTDRPG